MVPRSIIGSMGFENARTEVIGSLLRPDDLKVARKRVEAGEIDPRLSTVQRYAASIGKRVRWRIVDADA